MENLIKRSLKHNKYWLCAIFMVFICSSCSKQEIYYHFKEIKNAEWAISDTLIFNIDSTAFEINMPYSLNIEITNNVSYPYQNIWLFAESNLDADTIFNHSSKEYILADQFGKWNGSGFGSLYQSSVPLYSDIIFKEKRPYQIKITHGMRDDVLSGIEKIGLKVYHKEQN